MKKLFTISRTVWFSMVFLAFCCITNAYAQNWIQVNTDGFGGAVRNEDAPLIEYKNMLYVAVDNLGSEIQIWRTAAVGGPPFTDWEQVNTDIFGDGDNIFAELAVYNNFLYLLVSNEVTGCEVWRTAAVGGPPFTDWTQVNADGFGDADNGGGNLGVYNNFLYVVTDKDEDVGAKGGCEVWRTAAVGGPPFTDWTQVNTDGFGDENNASGNLGVYSNFLYVVTGDNEVTGAEVWRTAAVGGPPFTDWEQVNTDGFEDGNNHGGAIGVYNNFLYVVTTGNEITGAEVWRTAAVGGPPFTDWEQVNTDGFGDAGNTWATEPVVYSNRLYISVENSSGAEVWRTAAVGGPPFTDWTQINTDGFGDINNYAAGLVVYNNALYSATSNEITGCEVWEHGSWPQAYIQIFDNPSDLELLREYRDAILSKKAKGRRFKRLLYKNSEEALTVLLDNPELIVQLKALIDANKGAVQDVTLGYRGIIYNIDEIAAFLDAYTKKAPPRLRFLAKVVKRQMLKKQRKGKLFFGFKLE
jgi:hypothetical protein